MILNSKLFILPSDEIKTIGLCNLTYGSLTNKGIKTTVNTLNKYIDNIIFLFFNYATFNINDKCITINNES